MTNDDVAYGINIRGVYDGVSVWVLKDGTVVNRWAQFEDSGVAGLRARYRATQEYISRMGAE